MSSLEPTDFDVETPSASQRLSRGGLILWLVVIGLAILFVPLALFGNAVRGEVDRLDSDLLLVQQSLTSVPTPPPQVQELMGQLSQLQQQTGEVEAVRATLAAGRTDWQAIMAAIGNYNPQLIAVTSLTQSGNQLVLGGRGADQQSIVAYATSLENAKLFERVIVQSINSITTPLATATGTLSATQETITPTLTSTPTPTLTPTPDARDEFEPDDAQPKPVFLGQPQRHNFFPNFDVDQVSFLAKAGRFYRVSTFDLAPGVDTLLVVGVGTTSYSNDDRQPGSLNSEVTFQMPGGSDALATVRMTNRGQYGPDKFYQLLVEELVPTPTGTPPPTVAPSSTPTPTPTNTSVPPASPTNTSAPPPTLSPTPDLRDAYEPDDSLARPIALGETQTHNFLPQGDIDKVSFVAKAGRNYRVLTSDLALGVDTFLEVGLGVNVWQNDDYEAPGSNNFASAVCFQAPLEGTAVVTITNVARQYAPDKTYKVNVAEIPDLSVPPCPAPASPGLHHRAPGLALVAQHTARQAAALDARSLQPAHNVPLGPEAFDFVIILVLKAAAP